MNHIKKLAFSRSVPVERPEFRKKLFFPSLISVVSLISCAPVAHALPAQDPATKLLTSDMMRKSCAPEAEKQLRRGEKIVEAICRRSRDYVFTGKSLLVFTRHDEELVPSKITLKSSHSRTDMRGILSPGHVDWTASDDSAFFLTQDKVLTVIPAQGMGETVDTYTMPFDVRNAKLWYQSGRLFIAGDEEMMVTSFGLKTKASLIPYILRTKDRDFFQHAGKLFFGNERERIEIRFEGDRVRLH
jgi:hypothetical protein